MTIYINFSEIPDPTAVADSRAISDQLKDKLQPLADAIEEAGARLHLHYQEKGPCRLDVEGPEGLQEEIAQLIGPPETWS